MNWYVAFAFCIWDGGRLPSEAEWEFAASGGDANTAYPWGNSPPFSPQYADASCLEEPCSIDAILPVGSKPLGRGRYGQLDLLGSVWELNFDGFQTDWYTTTARGCNECVELDGTDLRALRGGSWAEDTQIYSTTRNYADPMLPLDAIGFRCARSP